MPRQSRGFWVCSYCEQAFDQWDQANSHEKECRYMVTAAVERIPTWQHQPQAPPQPAAAVVQPVVQQQPVHSLYPPTTAATAAPVAAAAAAARTTTGMAPLSVAERQHMPYPPAVAAQQQPQQQHLPPPPPLHHAPHHASAAAGPPLPPRHPSPKPLQRYLPLMGSQEPSNLHAADTLACRSTELFEVTDRRTLTGLSSSASALGSVSLGQVGLRCAFCAEAPQSMASYTFPPTAQAIGEAVRQHSFEHLASCALFPEDYQRQIREDLQTNAYDSRRRAALTEFCATRCQQAGIVDRHGGMSFADTELSSAHPPSSAASPYGGKPAVAYAGYAPIAYAQPPPHQQPAVGYGMAHPSPQQQQQAPLMPQLDQRKLPPTYGRPVPALEQQHASPMRRDEESTRRGPPPPQHPPPLAPSLTPPPPPAQQQPHYHHPAYAQVPSDFPFFLEHNRWVCKYCSHVPPPYRDPQFYWGDPTPPPGNFVDYHLSICREFQKGMMYDQQQQQPQTPLGAPPQQRQPPQSQPPPPSAGYPSSARPRSPMGSPVFAQPAGGWDHSNQAPRATPTRIYPPSPVRAGTSPYTPSYSRGGPAPGSAMLQAAQPATASDTEAARAIEYLEANDLSLFDNSGSRVAEGDKLILDEDRLLLTEYFFYLMKQLRLVRFSEADRRTRGGKREKIKVGYGGLQCVHCVDIPNTRKFFWSNVDRLANSFAEIPGHVLKCRRCPQESKDALLLLKQRHPEQMSRLPRGSQKVFFRRMWRRLHDEDPVVEDATLPANRPPTGGLGSPLPPPSVSTGAAGAGTTVLQSTHAASSMRGTMRPSPVDTRTAGTGNVPSPCTSASDESAYFLQRPVKEAAKALLDASMQPGPPSPSSRVLLAIPDDKEWLSDTDCFIRRQLEVFCATAEDVSDAQEDSKYPVKVGQIGLRCIHCALTKGARGQAVTFPFSISGMYEAAREFQQLHLENCENLPLSAKTKLVSLKGASSLSSVLRKYFVLAAKALGLKDSVNGILAGAESVAIGGQAAFAFAEESLYSEDTTSTTATSSHHKKRKADDRPMEGESYGKRAAVVGGSHLISSANVGSSGRRQAGGAVDMRERDDDDNDPIRREAV